MGRKKKKNKKKKQDAQAPTSEHCDTSHVTEELEALEAIFGDLYELLSDGMGCKVSYVAPTSLNCSSVVHSMTVQCAFQDLKKLVYACCRCMPFPGGSDENDKVVSLEARCGSIFPPSTPAHHHTSARLSAL